MPAAPRNLLQESDYLSAPVDLTNCDREPIHIPGQIQPHGLLLTYDPTLQTIQQVSQNWDTYGPGMAQNLLQAPMAQVFTSSACATLQRFVEQAHQEARGSTLVTLHLIGKEAPYEAVVHLSEGLVVVELEEVASQDQPLPFSRINNIFTYLEEASSVEVLCQRGADTLRDLTGFDRVMVYKFLEDDHGWVIAEAKDHALEPFLDLHYPASDIPVQARALYLRNRLRFIPDIHYTPQAILPAENPRTGHPLNLTFSVLRSVSPIHIEYLRNMGVGASMSVSIIKDGKLWGLFACHHSKPHRVPQHVRQACELFSHTFAARLAERQTEEERGYHIKARMVQKQLLQQMTQAPVFTDGLYRDETTLLDLVRAEGAAICFEDQIISLGQTPAEHHIRHLVEWLQRRNLPDVYATHALSHDWPEGLAMKEKASGILAISISKIQGDYLVWFRPEVLETVTWAGQPTKGEVAENGEVRLSPRLSFQAWKQSVEHQAQPWLPYEIESATAFRNIVIGIILRTSGELKLKADILSRLNRELAQSNDELDSFAYIASHDLKEPLRGIRNYANFLLEDYGTRFEEDGHSKLQTLVRLSQRMEELINSLLEFSRVGRLELSIRSIDLNQLVHDSIDFLQVFIKEHGAQVTVSQPLPTVTCDPIRVSEVFTNLITNAIKYNETDQPSVEIGYLAAESPEGIPTFYVKDNGIGVSERHFESIFRIFKRLHARDQYGGGTGAGLTIVKKIIDRHGGKIWLRSSPGQGSTFFFQLQPA
ncbi:Bacteriophytochrome (light-regulated signal transduction histidine kinase) [Catalinimonas alkaloidigena]|uniref:histidine kinase n=1 Tax=Catalinimonas alkaloidigena TaxID=1075417 RepID=A0A1G9K8E2_9BACT|nr:ATP-binding protein [Catalinimonas alkaloidigena]SDL45796.1 Bacteriophytochrome (light-regulated signal transduction histidine kinase) [Catalinimonas alkaloidigena]